MRFTINLATKIYINTKLLNVSTAAAILLLVLILILDIRYVTAKSEEMKHLTSEIATLDSKFKTASRGVSEKEYHALLDRIGFVNTVIEKKMYNWLDLLDKLEQVVPDGIAISSIGPDPKSHELKLVGVARSFNNLRIFMEHLEDSRFFTDVYLLSQSQSEAKPDNAAQGINFSLTCKVTK
jgi:type IV pilus assembly protein PilN